MPPLPKFSRCFNNFLQKRVEAEILLSVDFGVPIFSDNNASVEVKLIQLLITDRGLLY
jgi:hypothetical protein